MSLNQVREPTYKVLAYHPSYITREKHSRLAQATTSLFEAQTWKDCLRMDDRVRSRSYGN